ncbi:glycosyltransferase [Cryomorphaceae bacterium 1068]|nr:glycosyltransferase [Cryomorphaceae bacterium 1068]
MSEPLVSVIVLTYNHERFIKSCLEGILNQDYENLELIVCDDFSEDKTWEIIESIDYEKGRIRSFRNKENLGPSKNFVFALEQCKGDFIALCEGDDLWTNSSKLTLQMEGMNADSSVSLVYADYSKIDDSGKEIAVKVLEEQPAKFELKDMLSKHGPATNSIVIRKSAFPKKFPSTFFEVLNPDVFIIGFGLYSGRPHYVNKVLSAHREHDAGIWTSLDRFERGLIRYSTLVKFYQAIGDRQLEKEALQLFERQVILAREKDREVFQQFFDELPISRRWALGLKWAYANIKG